MENDYTNQMEKIRKTHLDEIWKISTDISYYLVDQIKYWLKSDFCRKNILQLCDSKIIIEKYESKTYCNFEVTAKSNNSREFVFYKSSKSLNNDEQNFYSNSTIDQFLRVLCVFKILEEKYNGQNKCYIFTQLFWDSLFKYHNDRGLSFFLIQRIKDILIEYKKEVNLCIEDEDYENNSATDETKIANNLFMMLIYQNDKYLFARISRIWSSANINGISDYSCEKLLNMLNQSQEFKTEIIDGIFLDLKKIYKKVWMLETTKKIENILYNFDGNISHQKSNSYLDRDIYENGNENNLNAKNFKSEVVTIEHLLRDQHKILIPIFQREYTWDLKLVKNLINTLILDYKNKKKSYLNNLILLNKGGSNNVSEIIDGQQRLITIILILNVVAKIIMFRRLEIPRLFYEMFLDKDNSKYLKNFFQNYEKIESYRFIPHLLEPDNTEKIKELYKDKSNSKKSLKIFEFSEAICENILENEKIGNFNIENFTKFLLTDVLITATNLSNMDGSKIFQNLNQNVKALNGLDLFRNYLYEQNSSSNSIADRTIEKYNKFFYSYFEKSKSKNSEIVIDSKKLLHFAKTLWKREYESSTSDINEDTDDMTIYKCLKKWYDKKSRENFEPDDILQELVDSTSKYEYLYKIIPKDSNFPKVEYTSLSLMLYSATYGGANTIIIPLLWELFDKFNAFKFEDPTRKNKCVEDLSQWIFRIERFMIYWKFCEFSGESLSESVWEITRKIHYNFEQYDLNLFQTDLLKMVPNLWNNKENLSELLKTKLKNKYANDKIVIDKKNANSPNKIKAMLLLRYGYYKNYNNKTIDSLDFDANNNYKGFLKCLSYDHIFPTNPDINDKYYDQDEYNTYTNMIGNGRVIASGENKSKKNKEISKITKYFYNNNINYSKELITDNRYQELILDESNEIINTLVEMYKLD